MSDRTIAPEVSLSPAATPGSTDEVAALSVPELSSVSPPPKVRLERLFSLGQQSGPDGGDSDDSGRPSVLHELILLLGRELHDRSPTDAEAPALATQLALLVWDGLGRPDVALPLLKDRAGDHPVAHALRLQAAIDDAQPDAALRALAEKLRNSAGPQDLAELGELLLFAAAHDTAGAASVLDTYALASELLAKGGEPRMRALSLTLQGKPAAAAATLESSDDLNDRLWAADLLLLGQPGLFSVGRSEVGPSQVALGLLESVAVAGGGDALAAEAVTASSVAAAFATMSALERLLCLAHDPRNGLVARRPEFVRRKFEYLGGLSAMTETASEVTLAQGRPSNRVELLGTALELAALLTEQSDRGSEAEAMALFDGVATFCSRHRELSAGVGRYLAQLSSARLHLRRGEAAAAAERYQTLAYFLVDLSGGRSAAQSLTSGAADGETATATLLDRRALTSALSYFGRAAELLERDGRDTASALRSAALLGRVAEFGCWHETLVLRRLRTLLTSGHDGQAEAISALVRLAEQATPRGDEAYTLRLWARAARASEALRIPGGDAYELSLGELSSLPPVPATRRDLLALARHSRRRGNHPELVSIYKKLGQVPARSLQPAGGAADGSTADATAAAVFSTAAVALALNLTDDLYVDAGLLALQAQADSWTSAAGKGASEPRKIESGSSLLADATRFLLQQRQGVDGQATTQVTEALNALLVRVRNPDTQAHLLRQLGHFASEIAADMALAERTYQQVLQRRPRDVMALHALARLAQQRDQPERAVLLLQQAVEAALQSGQDPLVPLPPSLQALSESLPGRLSSTGPTDSQQAVGAQAAALLCCELGTLYEHLADMQSEQTGAIDQALACYSEALRRDPRCRTAARALVTLYRTMGRPRELLSAMDRLLPLLRDDGQRLSLLLEIGAVATSEAAVPHQSDVTPTGDQDAQALSYSEQALRAYSQALVLQPSHTDALGHFVEMCRRLRRHTLLVDVLKPLPHTAEVLSALELAYGELGDPQALAAVLEEQLALLVVAADIPRPRIAQITRTLAELYQRLQRSDDEARAWERLYELAPDELADHVPALLALEKRYGQSGRHAEQAALLGRAIERLNSEQAQQQGASSEQLLELRERRRALLLRLGDVQRDFLGATAQATATFEHVLREWPKEPTALRALISLYGGSAAISTTAATPEKLADQRRILGLLLEIAAEGSERSRVLQQLGELEDKQNNIDEAFRYFGQAFFMDPANRPAFTSYERLCYLRKQWPEAIRMYDAALKLIETQKTRSYRPADLHVRRGQVLLTYLQQPDEALLCYLRALESDAENDNTQTTLEGIYANRNQWRELLSVYEKRASLVREDIKRVEILRRAAKVATAKLRDINEAVRFYEKLHAVDPTDPDALDALESHYERSRDNEKLYNLLATRVALSVDEQQIIALNMRIGTLCEEGLRDHDRAIQAYRHVIEVQPTHREALDAMARLFEANERWAELIDVTRRQIRLVTDRAQKALLYFKCGSVTEAKFGKEDDAIRYYEAAVRTSAACLPALHSLRDIYIRREDWTRVTQTLELESKLWTEEKERAGILAHIGQIFLDRLGNASRAIEFFEQALSVDKDSMPANRALFAMYFQRGDWERALAASQVLLQKASREGEPSERCEFHRKRAIVALRLSQVRMACDSISAALDVYPESLSALELLASLAGRRQLPYDFAPLCRELEKQYRRRDLPHCLARVLCAQAALMQQANDLEGVEALLQEAVRAAPHDLLPAQSLATFCERLRRFDDARSVLEQFVAQLAHATQILDENQRAELRARALLRLSEILSVSLMNTEQALGVLQSLIQGEPFPPPALLRDARFRIAQELFVLGRYADAGAAMESLIRDSSGTPTAEYNADAVLQPNEQELRMAAGSEELARYHHYLGRIRETQGEDAASQRAYRRAIDLVPTFSMSVVALARRALQQGERAQAELLLRDALTQVSAPTARTDGEAREENLQLRRTISRLFASIDANQAIDSYRQIIALATQQVPPESLISQALLDDGDEPRAAWETLDDRVALAELLLQRQRDPNAARVEIMRVLARDLRNMAAYPVLTDVYEQLGQPTRVERVRTVASLLGYGTAAERKPPPRLLAIRQPISDEQRGRLLWSSRLLNTPHFEVLAALAEGPVLSRLFPSPWPLSLDADREPQPANRLWDPAFKMAIADAQRLFGIEVDVFFVAGLPGYVLALEAPQPGARPIIVLDTSIMQCSDGERRFLLGRAMESLRSQYAFLLRLSVNEQQHWLRLMTGLLASAAQRDTATTELMQQLSESAQTRLAYALEQAAATTAPGSVPLAMRDPQAFLTVLPMLADRAGLIFCDDLTAALRILMRLHGLKPRPSDEPGTSRSQQSPDGLDGGILLGQVPGGTELARYYVSDRYHELLSAIRDTSRL